MIANNIINPGLDVYDIHCNRNSSIGGAFMPTKEKKKRNNPQPRKNIAIHIIIPHESETRAPGVLLHQAEETTLHNLQKWLLKYKQSSKSNKH